ncbi:hypothetical protein PHMEG_00011815 [Phytophthora megakarya]|uniref:Uncharacterized protein n=1 Tax=Phytophthora megakarya TaxID=4795 RepID=A0A225WAC8_9STRA|nr:hypothetical protein PHMEG_00011815 [Phytophthora megakarya]
MTITGHARTRLSWHTCSIDYGKNLENCLFIVAENCSVNRSLAAHLGIPLVGCASRRHNLVVQQYLHDYEDDLVVFQKLMRKMKALNYAAALRLLISILNQSFKTPLRPILRQDTCWGSTYAMVERYFRIAEFLPVDDDEVAEIIPNARSVKRLGGLLAELNRGENVSKALQAQDTTMLNARVWLDGLMETICLAFSNPFCVTTEPQADIVHSPEFEIACTKVRARDTANLTRNQRAVLQRFQVSDEESDDEIEEASFAAQLERKRK